MYSVPSPRWLWVATGTASKMRSISSSVKPSAASRSRERPATSSCAHGHAVMPWAATPIEPARAALGRDRGAEQRVHLLRPDARHGRRLVLGVAGGDRHLGPRRVLALAHALGDVLGERLGLEGAPRRGSTSPIASLTTSSKRDMCAPFWLRAEVDEALQLAW